MQHKPQIRIGHTGGRRRYRYDQHRREQIDSLEWSRTIRLWAVLDNDSFWQRLRWPLLCLYQRIWKWWMVLLQWPKRFTSECRLIIVLIFSDNPISSLFLFLFHAQISKEDIEKSYGGSLGSRTFYSSAYSSSTNAYMLMYRQIDQRRNVAPITREQFPDHIKVSILRFVFVLSIESTDTSENYFLQ